MSGTSVLEPETAQAPAENLCSAPTQQEIAELAYFHWEARGRPGGSPWEDWFRAERELKGRP